MLDLQYQSGRVTKKWVSGYRLGAIHQTMLSIRKIGIIGRTYRHLNRYRQILSILFKYGFGNLVDILKIEQYLDIGFQFVSRTRRDRVEKLSRGERIRLMFEELGPTFIKLGQILSTRPDLIPVDIFSELAKLQDNVPSFSYPEVENIVQTEFGAPIARLFLQFDEAPIASASIGQVHKARLENGEFVAVKVQRPGLDKLIEIDLEIMLHLAILIENNIEEAFYYRPVKVVEEFTRSLEKELDYTIEAGNIERMAVLFMKEPEYYIPKVYKALSTSKVITMEFIEGIKVSEIEKLDAAGLDRKTIIQRGANFVFRQVFENGFFHADPHPGNIFILPQNVICMIDFGMVGSVDQETRDRFIELLVAMVTKEPRKAMNVLLAMTDTDEIPDKRLLERDVSDFMSAHLYKSLKEIRVSKVTEDMLEIISRHKLRIRPDIFLMMKVATTMEGVARKLDPEFDMIQFAKPFAKKTLLTRLSPTRLASDFFTTATEFIHFFKQFPKEIIDLSQIVKKEKFVIRIELNSIEKMLTTFDKISNRISFAIVIAALIVGSALIVMAKTPPLFYGISIIGIIGFLTAAVMGFWLLIAIITKGRL